MQIDDKLISYLEELSCLSLSDDEKTRITSDLQKMLNGVSVLNGLNTDGVPERSYPFDDANVFRNDEVQPSFDRELILKNAPVRNDEFFIAPKTME